MIFKTKFKKFYSEKIESMNDKELYQACKDLNMNTEKYFNEVRPNIFVLKLDKAQVINNIIRLNNEKRSNQAVCKSNFSIIFSSIAIIIQIIRLIQNC